jgi:cell division protein FtsQ
MARRRNYNRHKRGRFGFLYKLLSVLVICVVIVIALTLFFRVDTITITGENRYSESEIIEATGLSEGDNLFLLNKYAVAEDLLKKLPYIAKVRINRILPDTLTIDVTESDAVLAVVQEGSAWLVSPEGKIVEQRVASAAADLAKIDGCELLAPSVATSIALSTDRSIQQESLLDLMKALDEMGMIAQVQSIHLDDLTVLSMDYADRFRVELPYGADYLYKLRTLQAILDSGKIESNEVGTIRMTGDGGQNVFIKD